MKDTLLSKYLIFHGGSTFSALLFEGTAFRVKLFLPGLLGGYCNYRSARVNRSNHNDQHWQPGVHSSYHCCPHFGHHCSLFATFDYHCLHCGKFWPSDILTLCGCFPTFVVQDIPFLTLRGCWSVDCQLVNGQRAAPAGAFNRSRNPRCPPIRRPGTKGR